MTEFEDIITDSLNKAALDLFQSLSALAHAPKLHDAPGGVPAYIISDTDMARAKAALAKVTGAI
jgi:hypothetical protein